MRIPLSAESWGIRGDIWPRASMDLRPAAQYILDIIQQESAAFKDRPIVALFGEMHLCPSHKLVEILVADGIRRVTGVNPAFGIELPHNGVWRVAEGMGLRIPPPVRRLWPGTFDPDGYATRVMCLAGNPFSHAPVAEAVQLAFLHDRGISVRFNDVADIDNGALDEDDPFTADLIARRDPSGASVERPASCTDDAAAVQAVRNFGIVENACRHIAQSGAPVYIQRCGRNHVFGLRSRGTDMLPGRIRYPYEQSLTYLFEQAGVRVIPIYMTGREEIIDTLPDAALLARALIPPVVPDYTYVHGQDGEEAFVRALSRASGGAIPLPRNLDTLRVEATDYVQIHCDRWVGAAMTLLGEKSRGTTPYAVDRLFPDCRPAPA